MEAKPISNTKLAQVAIVVPDIEEYAANYARLLGVEVPQIIETDAGESVRLNYRGAASDARCKLAFFDAGAVQIELLEPIGDASAWAEGLKDGGVRVHHIAFWTENMAEDKRALESNGAPMIMRGDMGDGQYGYFDGRKKLGVMIELLEGRRTDLD